MTILDKFDLLSGISDEWLEILDTPELTNVICDINKEISDGKYSINDITPPINKIFEFARLTELSLITTVILGQDPYPAKGDAHGLAFSCLTGIPASLKNVYKCLLANKLIDKMPLTGNLTHWAEQGILLINTSLTTICGKSNIHSRIWKKYTNGLISALDNFVSEEQVNSYGCLTFLLWGADAQSKSKLINNGRILTWAHPSPLAQRVQSFISCDHFHRVNERNTIDWMPIDYSGNNNNDCGDEKKEISERAPPAVYSHLGMTSESKKCIIFTDGSCNPNKLCAEARAGYAANFALGPYEGVVLYGNLSTKQHFASNQRAEGMAIIKTLEYLESHTDWTECIIISDSKFWISMIEDYMPNWVKNDIEFNTKKNPDLTEKMWGLYTMLSIEKTIEFYHINSHGKSGWGKAPSDSYKFWCYTANGYVDQLASYARINIKEGEHVEEMESI